MMGWFVSGLLLLWFLLEVGACVFGWSGIGILKEAGMC